MKKLTWFLLCCFAMNAYSNDEVSLTLVGHISPVCGFTTQNNNLQFSSDVLGSITLEPGAVLAEYLNACGARQLLCIISNNNTW